MQTPGDGEFDDHKCDVAATRSKEASNATEDDYFLALFLQRRSFFCHGLLLAEDGACGGDVGGKLVLNLRFGQEVC